MHLSERYVQKVALFHRSDWGGVGFKVQTMCGLFCPPPVLENHESSPLHLNYSMHCNCGTEMLQKCFALTLKSFFFFLVLFARKRIYASKTQSRIYFKKPTATVCTSLPRV